MWLWAPAFAGVSGEKRVARIAGLKQLARQGGGDAFVGVQGGPDFWFAIQSMLAMKTRPQGVTLQWYCVPLP